jgi:hypothetical protein
MCPRTLTQEQVDEIIAQADAAAAERVRTMPDERSALLQMHEAFARLKELGWKDAIYCPKDGSLFHAIAAGSTGIHDCLYMGEWPKGSWWIAEAGDLWPSRPILYRSKATPDTTGGE